MNNNSKQQQQHDQWSDLIAAKTDRSNELVHKTAVKCRKWNNIVPDQQNQKYKKSNQMRPNIDSVVIPCKQTAINNKAS